MEWRGEASEEESISQSDDEVAVFWWDSAFPTSQILSPIPSLQVGQEG